MYAVYVCQTEVLPSTHVRPSPESKVTTGTERVNGTIPESYVRLQPSLTRGACVCSVWLTVTLTLGTLHSPFFLTLTLLSLSLFFSLVS